MLWRWVLALTHRGGLWSEPIPLDEIESALQRQPQGKVHLYLEAVVIDTQALSARLSVLRASNASAWPPPSPGRDQAQGPYVWSAYSDQQLLGKVKVIYEAALLAYRQMVDEWFPSFRERMEFAVTLPARLTGVVIPTRAGKSATPPSISWFLDPLPCGAATEVSLQLASAPLSVDFLDAQFNKLCECRPGVASWISARLENSVLDIFGATPVTSLVYEWIKRDLKTLGWMS
jgi:hypothetical protein